MSGSSLGFVVEVLVALLLIATIGYCLIVNKKLEQLRSDKSELRAIVRDLHRATGQAEQAIGVLGETAETAERTLGSRIARAQDLGAQLDGTLAQGESLLSKLSVVGRAAAKRDTVASPERVARQPAAASPPGAFRHSELGLGLLNSQQRRPADGDASAQDAA